jgi:UDP:flavonoid glycosyltransferase YjiC (YdhE family)
MPQLRRVDASVLVYCPGIEDDVAASLQAPNVAFVREPVRMSDVTAAADAVVCAAGHGTVAAALLAGIPLTLVPNHLEQLMMARRAVECGAANMPVPGQHNAPYATLVNDVLTNPAYRAAAAAFAARHSGFDLAAQASQVADLFERTLAGPRA